MARIPEHELERLKREVSVVRLVEAAGIVLKKHGAGDLVGRCPFHEDRTPSLVVTPAKNLWHCLGACQAGGGPIDWVMRRENVSFTHAVETLRRGLPPLAAAPRKSAAPRKTLPPSAPAEDEQVLLDEVIGYYHEALLESPEARAYLDKRGLAGDAVIKHFRLGFANRTLGYRLGSSQVKAGAAARGALQRIGILRGSGHEHFNGSLVIPIFDNDGHAIEVYGRKITSNLRAGTPEHLYLPGPHRGVFNEAAIEQSKEIILCESLIDALTFWCAGYRHVTASYGVEGFTDEHLEAFKRNGIERILIAYDRDEAGNRAAEKLAERLQAEGLACFRVLFPKGMDANEYALKVTPATKSLGLALRRAEWLGNGAAPDVMSAAESPNAQECVEVAAVKSPPAPARASSSLAANSLAAETDAAPEPLPVATPMPQPSTANVPAEVREHEVLMRFGDRDYRVRGLDKNLSYEVLKVNILVARDAAFHVDTLDLYSAKHRSAYIRAAAVELGIKDAVIKHDLGQVLRKLEALQENLIDQAQQPQNQQAVALSPEEEQDALDLLRDANLIERLVADFARCGIVGEATNLLVGYLACVSRQLDKPLAVLIQSTSAAGKSALMEAVLQMMPEEVRVAYSAMTGQSLFYLGESDLKHKILAIAEEEGASRAAYALKLLQSEGVLTIASTGKDPASGQLVTQAYRVEGPVMLFLTTTAIEIDEELLNRCLVLSVNESREQTRAIQVVQRQRQTLEGLLADADKSAVLNTHRNAQRLLKPYLVANPYAEQLTFLDAKTRTRRDHVKYLTLIRAIALLHQHQRDVKHVEHGGETLAYIEVTPADIALANRLANEVLGRTLDELPAQTRRLLHLIHAYVTERAAKEGTDNEDVRFTRRDIREAIGWSDTQLRVHLGRLVALEYLLVHHGARGQRFVYELAYEGEGKDGQTFLPGLIEVERLQSPTTTSTSRGVTGEFAGPTRPQRGGFAARSRVGENGANADAARALADRDENPSETASRKEKISTPSYRDRRTDRNSLTSLAALGKA
ncbi:MAG: toprim domain-containing protein [Steroidobacteraceae bacterium]